MKKKKKRSVNKNEDKKNQEISDISAVTIMYIFSLQLLTMQTILECSGWTVNTFV